MTVIPTAVTRPEERRGRATAVRRQATTVLAVLLLLLVVVLLFMPWAISPISPTENGSDVLASPGVGHLLGTDQLGRDIYSRVVFGAQPVLVASLLGVLVATVAGVAFGIAAGIAPRWLNSVLMRIIDVLLAMPVLLTALVLIATIGSGVASVVVAISVAFMPGFARVVEASVRRLRVAEYVQAATVFGASKLWIAVRHLLPNLMTEVVVLASSAIGWAVLTASTLSFLGLGVTLPNPDWGSDLAAGATYLSTAWWVATFPGAAITVVILLANFAGDAVVDLLDPRLRRKRRRFSSMFFGDRAGFRNRGTL